MKKKQISKLSLNKKVITEFGTHAIVGGGSSGPFTFCGCNVTQLPGTITTPPPPPQFTQAGTCALCSIGEGYCY